MMYTSSGTFFLCCTYGFISQKADLAKTNSMFSIQAHKLIAIKNLTQHQSNVQINDI